MLDLARRSAGSNGISCEAVLLDEIAEAAFVIEPERCAFGADHVDAGADIADHIVGRTGDAERADAGRRALEARQDDKVWIVVEGGAAAHIGSDQRAVRRAELRAKLQHGGRAEHRLAVSLLMMTFCPAPVRWK